MPNFRNGLKSFGSVVIPGDAGNIYIVNNNPASTKGAELTRKYGNVYYDDGSAMLHQDNLDGSGIATAIAAPAKTAALAILSRAGFIFSNLP